MISFFTVPKPFDSQHSVLQFNAIASWQRSVSKSEILFCGDEYGLTEAAEKFGGRVITDVEKNRFGTPLISSAFKAAWHHARGRYLCYVNADIVLCTNLMEIVTKVGFREFLILAKRGEIERPGDLQSQRANWRKQVQQSITMRPQDADPFAIDLLLFPRIRKLSELPPFAVGRPGWDNWFVYNSLRSGVPVIDATHDILMYHQKHGYDHVPQRAGHGWEGPEADENRLLAGGWSNLLSILDASHMMLDGRVQTCTNPDALDRRVARLRQFRPRLYRELRFWKMRRLFCRFFAVSVFRA